VSTLHACVRHICKAIVAQSAQPALSPTNIFACASTPAQSIFDLPRFVLLATTAIFLVVFGLLAYAGIKFRKATGIDPHETGLYLGVRAMLRNPTCD
jgi:heme/copper-type cytochrome/quinol oxidase subunit 2